MAYSTTINFLLIFLVITFLSSLRTNARDSQFFNKVPTTTTADVPDSKQPLNDQQREPSFLPENENKYYLYGHDSAQLPPFTTTASTRQPLPKYLPKNYNPVAYVTEPEDINESTKFTEENSSPENNNDNYNQEESRYKDRLNSNNYHYNSRSSFNSHPQELSDTRFNGGYFRPQGMSDTRFMENGKYFYDVNTEKYSSNHPYESLRGNQARDSYNKKNFYGNAENSYEFDSENSMGGYQKPDEFQDEENNLP